MSGISILICKWFTSHWPLLVSSQTAKLFCVCSHMHCHWLASDERDVHPIPCLGFF
ncbi:hypothetical protein GQ55_8G009300 [Panicum hallii var. hallii]|uniref:Uncharacterized protein n=1 Tax=Panicum hallii var. hallii TaxID=1504633 RepID=A0A2T7CJL2_9POAL|nr:hypothetical protein GQ55_8G009300 [Panicum hallii var. hallii]